MTNSAQIHEYYKKVKQRKFFIFQETDLKYGDFWGVEICSKCKISAQYLIISAQYLHNI